MKDPGAVRLLGFAAALIAALAFYIPQVNPTVGFVDAPIYTRKAVQLDLGIRSIDHPLFMVIAHGFTLLPLGGNPAYRVNIASAFFGALTVALVFLVTAELLGSLRWGAYAAASGLTLWNLWWSSTEAEVYTLNTCFVLAICWAMLRFRRGGGPRWLVFAAFLTGLGVVNHQMIVLMVPGIALLGWIAPSAKRRWLWSGTVWIFGAVGLSLYLYLVLRRGMSAPWSDVALEIRGGEFSGRMMSGRGWLNLFEYIARFVGVTVANFDFLPLGLAIYGFLGLRQRDHKYFLFLFTCFCVHTIFFINYQVPDRFFFYLPSYILLLPVLGLGAWRFNQRWRRGRVSQVLVPLLLLYPIVAKPVMYRRAVPKVEEAMKKMGERLTDAFVPHIPGREDYLYYVYPNKRMHTAGDIYREMMVQAPPDAMIVDDWYHGFAIMNDYFQQVLGVRPDLTVIRWFEVFGGTEQDKDVLEERIDQALRHTRVFTTHTEYPITTLLARLERRGPLVTVQRGLLWELIRPGDDGSSPSIPAASAEVEEL